MRVSKKHVLIVDDEVPFLQSAADGLSAYASNLHVVTAENGKVAAEILETTPIHLVATDLKMPEMDGFELLAHLSTRFPSIPVIVMTAFGTPGIETRIRRLGAFHYLEKPIDFERLANIIVGELEAFHQGSINGVTLPGFLQLVEMEKKTCALKIQSREKVGFLYIRDGRLVDGKMGALPPMDAAYEILSWEETNIQIGGLRSGTEGRVDALLSHLMMDVCRIQDETNARQKNEQSAQDVDTAFPPWEEPNRPAVCPAEPSGSIADLEKERDMEHLKEVLGHLAQLEGVKAVCLVGQDGFLIDSISTTGMDAEMIGAIASGGFGASASMGREIDRGGVEMVMVEYENGPVIFSPVGDDAFIVVVAERGSNLGLIRVKIKKHTKELMTTGVF